MIETVTYVGRLVDVGECCRCGVRWAVPADFMKERRRDHRGFYCPNGHSQHYPEKSEEERLRDRNARLVSRLDQAEAEAREAELRRRAAKGQLTKIKKRVASGVCPCCNRNFTDLARHMASKHPGYGNEGAA